ncbi:MAG TPA: YceH family protein [Ilumatobacteraceae bacterium]|nr:YceH family protein [Ilumatobacteraceae bacterium]
MLTIVEGRVLGCLLEKQRTVPDTYPLTLNGLVTACNQGTSRDPVMNLAEGDVQAALDSLKAAGQVRFVLPGQGRSVMRYRQVFDSETGIGAGLGEPAIAVLTVLLLRGPQTAGEIRTRSDRIHAFDSVEEVASVLDDLQTAGHVELLERQPGQKEQRWRQLIAEEAETIDVPVGVVSAPAGSLTERVADLEARVARLEAALADLLSD